MIPYFLILLAFLADRVTKWWAAAYLEEHGPTTFNEFFTLYETYNRGIAFGLLQGSGSLVGWLTVGIVASLFVYLIRLPREERLMRAGLALLIGGALGNLVDRVTAGEVLDFIQTPLRAGIFNVADVMIHLGLFLALIGAFWQGSRKRSTVVIYSDRGIGD